MNWLLVVILALVVQSCCLVPLTPNPLTKPPLPLGQPHPRISPKWRMA